ncbi:MAG: hypothetical protein M3P18_20990 [Actinomycetota bacterium]|nr:hypothetical protein [Actinomycetota bacterium]
MDLKAVLLNCTLKPSPEESNTEALMRKVVEWFDLMDVQSDIVRVVDHDVRFGMTSVARFLSGASCAASCIELESLAPSRVGWLFS